jgi:hypothetical protein
LIYIQPSKTYKYTRAYKKIGDPGKTRAGELKNNYVYMGKQISLLSPLHRLLAHFDQTGLRLAIGEVTDGSNGLVSVFLGKNTSLFNTVTLVNELTRLTEKVVSILYQEKKSKRHFVHSPVARRPPG